MDGTNKNAQSLNAREISLRLKPDEFAVTLFYQTEPDARLVGCEWIRLVRLPKRLGTLTMLWYALGQDIIFRANLTSFTCILLVLAQVLGRKVQFVEWEEGFPSPKEMTAQQQRYQKFIFPRVKHYVGITAAVAEAWTRAFGVRAETIIPCGVSTKVFTPPAARNNARVRVLFVGPLMERKNPHVMLMAARCLPEAEFLLVGAVRDGFAERVYALKRKWGLRNVAFQAPAPQEEIARLMRESDVLFHPSKTEGCPKVVLEGAATGLPAVILNWYGAPVVVDGVTGFQDGDVTEMIEHVGRLVKDRELRLEMGRRAAVYAREFDWDGIATKWAEVFRDMVRGAR